MAVTGKARMAADLGVPEQFNAAAYFVDRHLAEGRGGKVAIECGDERVTYAELAERVNRCGTLLRDVCGVQAGMRVMLLLAIALQEHVRSKLADYKRPRWVRFIGELPKTATGKIQRFKLRAGADTTL